ncbi:hypothetical protein O3P69_005232 [Scylla paramamosain]|uniref:Uncharacterized protein n=1 Tax=Scylla paramamosain TaxID=85552 RepID=A0AAW0UAN5_SCYPA
MQQQQQEEEEEEEEGNEGQEDNGRRCDWLTDNTALMDLNVTGTLGIGSTFVTLQVPRQVSSVMSTSDPNLGDRDTVGKSKLLISHACLHIPAGVRGRPPGGTQVKVGGVSLPIGRGEPKEARGLAETQGEGGAWGMYRPTLHTHLTAAPLTLVLRRVWKPRPGCCGEGPEAAKGHHNSGISDYLPPPPPPPDENHPRPANLNPKTCVYYLGFSLLQAKGGEGVYLSSLLLPLSPLISPRICLPPHLPPYGPRTRLPPPPPPLTPQMVVKCRSPVNRSFTPPLYDPPCFCSPVVTTCRTSDP